MPEITDKAIRFALKEASALQHGVWLHYGGLSVYATPKGKAAFYSKHFGSRIRIGSYTNAKSIDTAKEEHNARLTRMKDAPSLIEAKEAERAASAKGETLGEAMRAFFEHEAGLKAHRSAKAMRSRLTRCILRDPITEQPDPIAARRIKRLTREDWRAFVSRCEAKLSPNVRNSLWGNIGTFLNWYTGDCDKSAFRDVARYIDVNRNVDRKALGEKRTLKPGKIKAIWNCAEGLGYPYGHAVRFILATGMRRSEAFRLQWAEIGEAVIELSEQRMKNGVEHALPITPTMRAILDDCRAIQAQQRRTGDHVFSTDGGKTSFGGFSRVKAVLHKLLPESEQTPWRLHDIRHTFTTAMCKAMPGAIPFVELCQARTAPVLKGAGEVYRHTDFFDEKLAVMLAWEKHTQTALAIPR